MSELILPPQPQLIDSVDSQGTWVKLPGLVERWNIGTRSCDFLTQRKSLVIKLFNGTKVTVYPALFVGVMHDKLMTVQSMKEYIEYPQWKQRTVSCAIYLGLAVTSALIQEKDRLVYDDETELMRSLEQERKTLLQNLAMTYGVEHADISECFTAWNKVRNTLKELYPEIPWAASLNEIHSRKRSGLKPEDESDIVQ